MCCGQRCQGVNPVFSLVQTRDVAEVLAPGLTEFGFSFQGNFFKCFKTVGRKTRADDIHPLDALFGKRNQCGGRVGPQPFGPAKAGLEADLIFIAV